MDIPPDMKDRMATLERRVAELQSVVEIYKSTDFDALRTAIIRNDALEDAAVAAEVCLAKTAASDIRRMKS